MSRVLWDTGYSITVEAAFSAAAGAFGVWDSAVWDDATWGPDVVWSDVSQDLYAWTSKIGRDRENDHYVAATGSVVLDNSEGNYTPENLDGDYVAAGVTGVRPGRPLRGYITRLSDGARFPLFYGTIEDFDETVVSKAPRTTFAWVDGIADLAAADGYERDPVGGGESVGVRMHRILDDAEWEQPRDIDVGSTTVQATTLAQPAWTELLLSSDSEGGETWVNPDGTFVFQDREGPLRNSRSNAVQYVFTDTDAPGALHYEDLQLASGMDILVTDAALARAGGQVIVRSDLEARALYRMHRWGRNDLICETDAQVEMLASTVVARRSNPERRPRSIRLRPRVSPEILAVVVALRLWDRVTVTRQHERSETTITHDCFVDGIEHTFSGGDWVTVVRLASADAFATADQFGVWGTSLWDTAVWAPARVSAAIVSGPPAETGLPDMRVDDIGGWDTAVTGDEVVLWAAVKNYGTASTPVGVAVDCAFSIDGVTVSWSDDHLTQVAPGATVILTANSGPAAPDNFWTATAGLHTVTATVNTGPTGTGRFNESDRSNNSRFELVNIVDGGGIGGPCTAPEPIQVAHISRSGASTVDTLGVTFAHPVTPGNSVILLASPESTSVVSVSGLGGTWAERVAVAASTGFLGIYEASEVAGPGSTVTVVLSGGDHNIELWVYEVPGPTTFVDADVIDDASSHGTILGPTLDVDDCAFHVALGAMSNPITAGPTDGYTGVLLGDDYWFGAYLAADDHGPHDTTVTIDTPNIGGAIAAAVFTADGNAAATGGGGGGGGAGVTPLWIGAATEGGSNDLDLLIHGGGYGSIDATTVLDACGGIAVSYSHAWRDGLNEGSTGGLDSGVRDDLAAAVAFGFDVWFGGHVAHASSTTGPPTVGEISSWLSYIQDLIDLASAAGCVGLALDFEPYGVSTPENAWDGYADDPTAWYNAGLALGAALIAANLSLLLYGSSNFNVPDSNNYEILVQALGAAAYYADCRAIGIMAGLNDSNADVTWLDASFHFGAQNDNVSNYAEGAERVVVLGTAIYPNLKFNIMNWPDNDEGHGPFDPTEVQEGVAAMVSSGTGNGVIYQHNALGDYGIDYETEWHDDWYPAIQAGRGL